MNKVLYNYLKILETYNNQCLSLYKSLIYNLGLYAITPAKQINQISQLTI